MVQFQKSEKIIILLDFLTENPKIILDNHGFYPESLGSRFLANFVPGQRSGKSRDKPNTNGNIIPFYPKNFDYDFDKAKSTLDMTKNS